MTEHLRPGAQASNLRAPSIRAGRILPAFTDRSVNEFGRLANVLPAWKTLFIRSERRRAGRFRQPGRSWLNPCQTAVAHRKKL